MGLWDCRSEVGSKVTGEVVQEWSQEQYGGSTTRSWNPVGRRWMMGSEAVSDSQGREVSCISWHHECFYGRRLEDGLGVAMKGTPTLRPHATRLANSQNLGELEGKLHLQMGLIYAQDYSRSRQLGRLTVMKWLNNYSASENDITVKRATAGGGGEGRDKQTFASNMERKTIP